MFTKKFWMEATERALKTFAQMLLVTAGGVAFNVFTADWLGLLGLSLGGMLVSYATSILSANVGKKKNDPSLVS